MGDISFRENEFHHLSFLSHQTRLTEGVDPALRQWIVNSCVLHVCSYLAHMTQLPDNEVVPLLVLRTTTAAAPTVPLVQQLVVPQTQSETEVTYTCITISRS